MLLWTTINFNDVALKVVLCNMAIDNNFLFLNRVKKNPQHCCLQCWKL